MQCVVTSREERLVVCLVGTQSPVRQHLHTTTAIHSTHYTVLLNKNILHNKNLLTNHPMVWWSLTAECPDYFYNLLKFN